MEFKEQLACGICQHVYVKQGELNTPKRYCPNCYKFTDIMLLKILVEDEKHK